MKFNHRFNSYVSLPAPGAQRKQNAQILVHDSLVTSSRRAEVDYVSIVASGRPFEETATLVACIYLNPHRDAASTTRENTVRVAQEDIMDFLEKHRSSGCNILIGGDLNCDPD